MTPRAAPVRRVRRVGVRIAVLLLLTAPARRAGAGDLAYADGIAAGPVAHLTGAAPGAGAFGASLPGAASQPAASPAASSGGPPPPGTVTQPVAPKGRHASAAGAPTPPTPPASPLPPAPPAPSPASSLPATPADDTPAGPPLNGTGFLEPLPPARLTGRELLDGPPAITARRTAVPPGVAGAAMIVPFGLRTGAAMFSRGGTTYLVFDERRPIDMAGLRGDRAFGAASVVLLPTATLIRLPVAPDRVATLAQTAQGWRISLVPTPPRLAPIVPTSGEGRITLAADAPGQVVSIPDPDSGATLLVGTQRRGGQAVLTPRRGAEFDLLLTGQGVVAEPLADRVGLRVAPNGFMLVGEPGGLALSPGSEGAELLADAIALTRRFHFPHMPTEVLARHLAEQMTEIASVPLQARGPRRLVAARSMLALGMAAEAGAMLQLAAEQAPRTGLSAEFAGLSGVAALLAGRIDDAGGLSDPRLSGTDEIALWRAIRGAMRQEGSPRAAAVMAATSRLALTYPDPIRDRILPLIAETMILGGEAGAAAALLKARPEDPHLAFARALLKQAQGDAAGALVEYDVLAAGRDQRDRSRAAVRAVELRLAQGLITPHEAAERLDRLLYAWRGDALELGIRDRLATLRQQAGEWAKALAILRNTEADFPDIAPATHARLLETFAALLREDAADRMSPLDLVTLADTNADLLPATPEGEVLEAHLADRLLALDLPKRADPLLAKLMGAAPTGVGRAGFGQRLAALRLREGDPKGALAALDQSDSPDLPPDLAARRTMLFADASAQTGSIGAATAALAALGTQEADEKRATILERAQDWPAATAALRDYVGKTIPGAGPLAETQQRVLLRLATAAARAGDEATLAALRTGMEPRMAPGPLTDLFRLLTAESVRGTGDLPRAGMEAGLVRSLPRDLDAFRPKGPTAP